MIAAILKVVFFFIFFALLCHRWALVVVFERHVLCSVTPHS